MSAAQLRAAAEAVEAAEAAEAAKRQQKFDYKLTRKRDTITPPGVTSLLQTCRPGSNRGLGECFPCMFPVLLRPVERETFTDKNFEFCRLSAHRRGHYNL